MNCVSNNAFQQASHKLVRISGLEKDVCLTLCGGTQNRCKTEN